jgi:antirestriction protein ArdC
LFRYHRLIDQIKKGTPPWRQPWSDQASAIPHNIVSKRPYKGINILLLWDAAAEHGYSTRWATYRQWQALGNQVRRGERGTRIYHWKDTEQHTVVREHTIFAAEQCNDEFGHPVIPPSQSRTFIDHEPAQRSIFSTRADIRHGGKACYSVDNDESRQLDSRTGESHTECVAVSIHLTILQKQILYRLPS